jgi:hypothetical protein
MTKVVSEMEEGNQKNFIQQYHQLIQSNQRHYDLGLGRVHGYIRPELEAITDQYPKGVTNLHSAAVKYTQNYQIMCLSLYSTRQKLHNIGDKDKEVRIPETLIPELDIERQRILFKDSYRGIGESTFVDAEGNRVTRNTSTEIQTHIMSYEREALTVVNSGVVRHETKTTNQHTQRLADGVEKERKKQQTKIDQFFLKRTI